MSDRERRLDEELEVSRIRLVDDIKVELARQGDENRADNIGLFDMDESMADYEGQLQIGMEALQAPGEPRFDIATLHGAQVPDHLLAREKMIKRQPGWWFNLLPIPSGIWAYETAKRLGFDNRVLTRGPSSISAAWEEKQAWCRKHLGDDASITITRNKDNAYGKFLYDDFPPYALDWLAHRPRGVVIMPMNRHNASFVHPRVFKWDRMDNLRLEQVLIAVRDRRPNQHVIIPD